VGETHEIGRGRLREEEKKIFLSVAVQKCGLSKGCVVTSIIFWTVPFSLSFH